MKVLFIIESLSSGGAERVTANLSNYFSQIKDVTVYVSCLYKSEKEYSISKSVKLSYCGIRSSFKYFQHLYELGFIKSELERIYPDAIISLAGYGVNLMIEIANKQGIPIILSERNDPNRKPSKIRGKLIRYYTYRHCDGLVFQTEDAKNYFSKSITRDSIIIPNPVNMNKKINRRVHFNEKKFKKTIVNCSRLEDQKNLPLLIDSFKEVEKKHNGYTLHIYGDGTRRRNLEQYAKDSGVGEKVIFHGFVGNVIDEIMDSGVYVSTSDYEGISNSMIEAMALGIPVVCTDCPIGGARMMIKDGINGLLVPVGSKSEVAKAIERIIDDKEYAFKLGENARSIVNEISIEVIGARWLEYIKYVITKRIQ